MSHRSFRDTVVLSSVAPFIKKEKLGVVVHAFSPRTWGAEAFRSQTSEFGASLVYDQFQISDGYIVRP